MSERVSDEYLTRIIEQKAGAMPMHLALDLRDARASLDVLRRNGINAFCLSVDEAKDPHRACAALRAERDELAAKLEAVIAPVEAGGGIESHYKAERDAALAEVERLRGSLHNVLFGRDVLKAEVERLRAEVERMRPVVERAIVEREIELAAGLYDPEEFARRGGHEASSSRRDAVDAYRASAQKEGEL